MTLRTFAFASLSVLALSACAVGPDYASTPPPPAASGPFLSIGSPPVSAEPLPEGWWQMYQDPVLDRLVADALAANTDVRQALARIERARAAVRGAGAGVSLPHAAWCAGVVPWLNPSLPLAL